MIISSDISKAVEILTQENLVAIPTETVYGLAGNIFSEKAIRKIFEMKKRPFFNPLIVHLHSTNQLVDIVADFPEKAKELAHAFWPGPLTLILPKKDIIPNLVTASKETVAVRIPNHPTTLELLKQLGFPLAAPSANTFGNISPTKASHVKKYFDGKLEMVLDGGDCKSGIESTIVAFEKEKPIILRLGSISIEEIGSVVGKVSIQNKKEKNPLAPGMLSRHYAPSTPTFLVSDVLEFLHSISEQKIGLLLFSRRIENQYVLHQEILSKREELKEASSNLYAALHRLDAKNLDIIICERLPEHGIGKSINDRLERATKK